MIVIIGVVVGALVGIFLMVFVFLSVLLVFKKHKKSTTADTGNELYVS